MNKSSLKNLLLTVFGLLLIISSCSDLGCFDPGDDGTEIKSIKTYLLPLNENSVSNPTGNFQPITGKKEKDFYYTWKSLQYNKDNQNSEKDDGGPKNDFYVYAGKRVSVSIDGSIMLAGFRITEDIPLEIQKITYTENGADKTIYASPLKLLPLYVNPGEKVLATYIQKGPIPKLGGVELKNGLGMFIALIESEVSTIGRYGNYRKWTCTDAIALNNRCESTGDNITNCSDHTDYEPCSPLSDTWCSGFHSRNDTELKGYGDRGANTSLVDSLSLRERMANPAFYLLDRAHYIFRRSFGVYEYKGMNISSGTADKDSRHDNHGPTYPSVATCGGLFNTPWSQLKEFAMCTHDFTNQGWAANHTPIDDAAPQIALMSGVGPLSRWYFTDPSQTCESLDTSYGIKNISGFFGGTYEYVASDSRVYWSTQSDKPRLECDNKENGSYYCNEVSSFTRRVRPKICENSKNIKLKWPLQIVLARTGLADNSPLNRGDNSGFAQCVTSAIANCKSTALSGIASDSFCNNVANKACSTSVSSASCKTTLTTKSDGKNYDVQTSGGQKTWIPFSVLLQESETIDLNVSGTFDHSHHHLMSKGAFSDWVWNLYPAEMYSDVAGGGKPCSSISMYAVQPLTFVSCFSRFESACSNQRVPTTFCKESRDDSATLPQTSTTPSTTTQNQQSDAKILIGSCKKKYKKAPNEVVQAYQYPDYKRVNTLIDSGSTVFSEAENIEEQHCGVCVKKGLPFDDSSGLPLVTRADFSDSSTIATITTRAKCETSKDYQWIAQYYDKDVGDAVSITFIPNRKVSICLDSESNQVVKNKINSLTNIAYKRTTGASGNIIFGGIFSNLGTSGSASIEIPNNNKRYFVIAGYAGNGDNMEQLFTEGDMKDNTLVTKGQKMKNSAYIEKITGQKADIKPADDTDITVDNDVFRASQLSLISGTYLKNGEGVYVYIQEFKKNPDGSYTSELDPDKHPAKVFGEFTHPNDIIKKMSQDSSIPIREYTTSFDMLDGWKDGLALWKVSISGKLWFAIMDHKPNIIDGRTDGRYITFSADKDGDLDPKVKEGLSNVLYWNSGRYNVIAKTESNRGSVTTDGWISDKINVILVEFVKQIFFGRKITDDSNCKTILKPKAQDDTPTDKATNFSTVQLGDVENPIKPVENACKQGFADGSQNMPFNIKEQFCQSCARLAFNDPVKNAYVKLSKTYLGPANQQGTLPCNTRTINGTVSDTQFECNPDVMDACTYNGFKTMEIVNAGDAQDIITICPKPTPPLAGGTILYECKNATRAYKHSLVDEELPNEPYRIADESSVEIKQCTTTYTMGCYLAKAGSCRQDHDIDGELLYVNTGGGYETGISADFGSVAERQISPASSYDRIIKISTPISIKPERGLGGNTAWCNILLDTGGNQNYKGTEGAACATKCYDTQYRNKQIGFKDTTEIFYTTGTSTAPRDHIKNNTALTVSADAYLLPQGKPITITYRTPSKTAPYDFCYNERSKYTWAMAFINTTIEEIIFAKNTNAPCPAGIVAGKTPSSTTTELSDLDIQIKNMVRQNGCSTTAVKDCLMLIRFNENTNNAILSYDPNQPQQIKRRQIIEGQPTRCVANDKYTQLVLEVKNVEFQYKPQFKDKFNWCHLKDLSGGFMPTQADLEECGTRCYGDKEALKKNVITLALSNSQGCDAVDTTCRRPTATSPDPKTTNWQTSGLVDYPQFIYAGCEDGVFLEIKTPDHSLPTCPDAVPGATYKMPIRTTIHIHRIGPADLACPDIRHNWTPPTFDSTAETVIFDKCGTASSPGTCSDPLLRSMQSFNNNMKTTITDAQKRVCIADIPIIPSPPVDPSIVKEIDIPAQPSTCNPLVKNADGTTTMINKIIQLDAKKYGDCKTQCPSGNSNCAEYEKTKTCTIYEMYKNNNPEINIFECLRKPFSEPSCWQKKDFAKCPTAPGTGANQCTPAYATEEFSYPYDNMQDDDFTTDSISPGCSQYDNKPFKTFENCKHSTETFTTATGDEKKIVIQKCDIKRNCGGERVQKDAKMPADINYSGGADVFTNANNGASFKVKTCKPQYTQFASGGKCSDIKNIQSTDDLKKLPDYDASKTTQAQLDDSLNQLKNSWCIREVQYDCKTCKRLSIKGSDGTFRDLTQTGIASNAIPNQYGCQTPDNRMFFCNNSEIGNVCGSGLGSSNVTVLPTGENINICDTSKSILETTKDASEANALSVGKNFSFSGEDCEVQFKCFSQDDIDKSQSAEAPPNLSNAGMSIQDSNKYETIKVCTSTRAWSEGFIYLLFKTFTGNFNLQVIIYLTLILMLTMKGYGVILGNAKLDQTSMVKDAINLSIVLGFFSSTGWDLYEKYVLTAILNFMDDVNSLVTRAMNPEDIEGRNPFGPIDDVFNTIFLSKTTWYRVLAILFGRLTGFIFIIAILFSFFSFLMIFTRAVIQYLSSLIILSMYLSLGPIFILFKLHPRTANYFTNWWQGIMGFLVAQFYLFSIIALFTMLYLNIVEALLYFKVCYRSIITIPVVNVSILGWFVLADEIPANLKVYFDTFDTTGTSQGGGYPSLTELATLLIIVATMEKFVTTPLFGGKAGRDSFFKDLDSKIKGFRDKGRQVATSAATKPFRAAGGFATRKVGQGAGLLKKGASKGISKSMGAIRKKGAGGNK